MAKRHVEEYFNTVANQWLEMQNELNDFAEEARKGLFPPERLEEIKTTIQPIKTNYETLSYIMFLLNMPNRKAKETKYVKSTEVSKNRSKDVVIAEGERVLNSFKSS
jgi:hypothetical protein